MNKLRLVLSIIFVLCVCLSCKQNSSKNEFIDLVKQWEGKQIVYPSEAVFTIYGRDTVINYEKYGVQYSIVSYIDSLGCFSCKLQAKDWQNFIKTIDSVSKSIIPVNIFVHNRDVKGLSDMLKRENFNIPLCLDLNDSLRILNNLPANISLRTFLLNENNRVVAIGNPVFNPKVKELYLKIIQGEKVVNRNREMLTELFVNKYFVDFGSFDWNKEQKTNFTFKNVGDKPLIIQDVNTSCGCISVNYSKEPIQPHGEIALEVVYKADHPEHFSKTITVYCNTKSSPIKLSISGNAE